MYKSFRVLISGLFDTVQETKGIIPMELYVISFKIDFDTIDIEF